MDVLRIPSSASSSFGEGHPKQKGESMETYVISDTHFSHEEILKHCRRPWCVPNPAYDPTLPYDFRTNHPLAVTKESLEAHDQTIIDNWNSMVTKKDRVIIVGDFAFRNHAQYASMLHGRKILVMGNHDDMTREALKHFAEVYDFGCVKKVMTGATSQDGKIIKEKVTFCHYAMRAWPGSWDGTPALHGHSHGRMPELDILLSFDVGVDVWGYAPIPWEAIQRRIDEKRASMRSKGPAENGDGRPRGSYSSNPDERVIETRARNMAVLKAVGINVKDDAFSLSPECLKALDAQRDADRIVTSLMAVAGTVNRHGRTYSREYLRSIGDGRTFLWDEATGSLTVRCRAGLAGNPAAAAKLFKDRLTEIGTPAPAAPKEEVTHGQVGVETV